MLMENISTYHIDHTILDETRTICLGSLDRPYNNTPLLNLIAAVNTLDIQETLFTDLDTTIENVLNSLGEQYSQIVNSVLGHVDNFPFGGHTAFGFLVRQGKHRLAEICLDLGAPVIHPERPHELLITLLQSFGTTINCEMQDMESFKKDIRFLAKFLDKYLSEVDKMNTPPKISRDAMKKLSYFIYIWGNTFECKSNRYSHTYIPDLGSSPIFDVQEDGKLIIDANGYNYLQVPQDPKIEISPEKFYNEALDYVATRTPQKVLDSYYIRNLSQKKQEQAIVILSRMTAGVNCDKKI